MQLKRGARETLLHLYSDLDYLIAEAHDPIAVEMLARRIRERIREEIEPRLSCAIRWATQYVPEDERTLIRPAFDAAALRARFGAPPS